MQIEHVARIGFAARRAAQQQRHLAVGHRLFRQIVVDDDGMHAVIAEVFAHGAAGERRDVLHRRRVGSGGCDDDRIFQRALLFQHLDELRHGRALLADRDIDAVQLDLLVGLRVERLLVENGVERDRSLAGLAVLDLAVGAEDHDADIVGLQVQRHAAGAVLELDHFAGLDVVEAVDAGDAVADGQHLSDFGNLSLLAEILDLVLEDRGNFRGADVHQPASFIACLIELSLVRSELSTMRLPSLTTRPPMIEESTLTLSATSLPVTDFSAVLRASRFLSLRVSATVTSAVASPLNLATSARNARITSLTTNRRRLAVRTLRNFAEMPDISALSSTAASAFDCKSAENTGLRTSRFKSALSASMASNLSRSALTASTDFSSRANSNKAVA